MGSADPLLFAHLARHTLCFEPSYPKHVVQTPLSYPGIAHPLSFGMGTDSICVISE